MQIDIISIFPSFFDVLDISLLGKAREKDILQLRVHDLRDATSDKHRTVDDKPAGGGAGMVMKAEPWGEMLDRVMVGADPLIIFPSPAGEVFNQAMARELAEEKHLVFGCGRYEGIDQRVIDYASDNARVKLVSLGDYILNGGEVATVAMVEAIARLVPGVLGNPESLVEESHEKGLLEYPVYTAPAIWREREIPEVLLSGNHAKINAWRTQQSLERTKLLRPDLLPES